MLYEFIDILQPTSSGCEQLVQVICFTLPTMRFLDLNFVFKCFKTLPGSWTNPSLRLLALLCCIVIDIFRLMTLYDQNHGRPSAPSAAVSMVVGPMVLGPMGLGPMELGTMDWATEVIRSCRAPTTIFCMGIKCSTVSSED